MLVFVFHAFHVLPTCGSVDGSISFCLPLPPPPPVCKQRRLARDRFNLALGSFLCFQCDFLQNISSFYTSSYSSFLHLPSSLRLIPLSLLHHLLPLFTSPCLFSFVSLTPPHFLAGFTLAWLRCCILLLITFSLVWPPSRVSDLAFTAGEKPPQISPPSSPSGLVPHRSLEPRLPSRPLASSSSAHHFTSIPVVAFHTPFPVTYPPLPPLPHIASLFRDTVSSSHPRFFLDSHFHISYFFSLPLQIFHLTTLEASSQVFLFFFSCDTDVLF